MKFYWYVSNNGYYHIVIIFNEIYENCTLKVWAGPRFNKLEKILHRLSGHWDKTIEFLPQNRIF